MTLFKRGQRNQNASELSASINHKHLFLSLSYNYESNTKNHQKNRWTWWISQEHNQTKSQGIHNFQFRKASSTHQLVFTTTPFASKRFGIDRSEPFQACSNRN